LILATVYRPKYTVLGCTSDSLGNLGQGLGGRASL